MESLLRVGFIQFAPRLGQPAENLEQVARMLDESHGARIIVLPELANSGYNFRSFDQALKLAESVKTSSYIHMLMHKAKDNNQFIVSGFLELDEGSLYNTAVLIGPQGLVGKYRKVHLFLNEFDFFKPGNLGFPVFDLGFCKIGMLICFDWIFPEAWRILALKGADLVCHPSNLVLPYAQQAVPVHGLINRMYIVTANRYGTEREVTFSGKSFISDPDGNIILMAEPSRDQTGIIEIEILTARNKMITHRNHSLNDRRPDLYNDLVSI